MSKIPHSINNARIKPEQKKHLIALINKDIELLKKEHTIFQNNAKKIAKKIKILEDIKCGRASLHYFLKKTKKL